MKPRASATENLGEAIEVGVAERLGWILGEGIHGAR
jgi:hypothetical protein